MNEEYKQVLPDPERVIEGLRDTGYQLETAVEDIIDNSITAESAVIDLQIDMDFAGDIGVYIADNGYGMNREELVDAMRYGSKRRSDPASLGKFGLGLKTASTAFCRQLSVVSRDKNTSSFLKATWDLDHVAKVGDWMLRISDPSQDELERIKTIAKDGPGTLVIWNKVDRLLKNYSDPGGKHAQKALEKNIQILKDHIAMVYQRFLDPKDSRGRKVEIRVNGEKVEPWNPFCPDDPDKSQLVAKEDVQVDFGDKKVPFSVRAYVLPRKEEFSSTTAWKKSRPGIDMQGIYVYREDRLIYGPEWLRMFSKEPHLSLLRVEFSFDHKLDDAFHIDIKKSQIILNEELRIWLDKFLIVPRRAADQRYRSGERKKAMEASSGMHDSSNKNIHDKASEVSEAEVKVIDSKKSEVEVTNKYGSSRLIIKITQAQKPGEVHVQPVPGIDDGLLWEPGLIENNKAVRINTGHEYYSKVYLPNQKSGVTVQGLDSLLWALCEAEWGTMNDQTHQYFEEMRREVSRILRILVKDLPEPVNSDDEV